MQIVQNRSILGHSRSKTPFTSGAGRLGRTSESQLGPRRRITELFNDMSAAKKNQKSDRSNNASAQKLKELAGDKSLAGMSVNDYVRASFRDSAGQLSELNYPPTDANLKKSVLLWKQVSKKTSFLDPIIKIESKRLGPHEYNKHKTWSEELSATGNQKKGVF